MYRQDPPFAVQIELVEGCTLSCDFCGVNGIREKPGNFKFMSDLMVMQVATRLQYAMRDHGWNPRIEFAMHGEPSMHPALVAPRCRRCSVSATISASAAAISPTALSGCLIALFAGR
jgi:hypothetical protein